MEAMRGQGGIQMLLTAEQEAQQIVSTARNKKLARLKQAKEEAEREVATFRATLESEYQKNISDSTGNSGTNVKRLDDETAVKIRRLKDATARVRPDVTGMLMKQITTIRN